MGNQYWALKIQFQFIFATYFLIANTYTCSGAGNITTVACSKQERLALLNFKHSVQNDYGLLSSWVGDECCLWERVHCDSVTGYVVGLYLRGNEDHTYDDHSFLVGKDGGPFLRELRHLKYLDLSYADLSGAKFSMIPSLIELSLSTCRLSNTDLGLLLNSSTSLSNIKHLDLSYNSFYGQVPHSFQDMTSLQFLDLSGFKLSLALNSTNLLSMIPSLLELHLSECNLQEKDLNLTTLSNIQHLDLSRNFFQDKFPSFLTNVTSLRVLDLQGCRLNSPVPVMSNVLELDLSDNNFQQLEDLGLWRLVNLRSLLVRVSDLTGTIPEYFGKLKSLEILDISGNYLTGSIPTFHCKLTRLDLSGNNLNGSIPVSIGQLTNLQLLDISDNWLNGTIPASIGQLTNLQHLDISHNSLNGTIPVSIGQLTNLQHLEISHNSLYGTIPVSIGQLTNLQRLDIYHNLLYGTIPVSIGQLTYLQRLDISYNWLNGTIPVSIGKLTNLQSLDISYNSLYGTIPASIGQLTNLQSLDISYNSLYGIPVSIGQLTNLQSLHIPHNSLNGTIPVSIGQLTNLQSLDISYNSLNGTIPVSIGQLTNLQSLDISYNSLYGTIPASIGQLTNLQSLDISYNSLNGIIPVSIGQLNKLEYLDISQNSLEGLVSEAHFVNLSMLEDLNLASNSKLTFNFSHEWMPPFKLRFVTLSSCKIADGFPELVRSQRKLENLELSNCTISGPLPIWLRELSIKYLDLSHNNLTGPLTNLPNTIELLLLQNNLFNESIPRSICTSTNLYVLNLSRNRLSGKIPNCVGDLQNLKSMMLSSNGLSGVIPSSLGLCSALKWLNLNENSFIGELPQELGNISTLKVLDLGDNKFFGNIPKWTGEKLADLLVFRVHKNNFTGTIPPSLCDISHMRILDVAHNSLTGPVPYCLGELHGMVLCNDKADLYPDYDQKVKQVLKGVVLEYTKTLPFLCNMDLSSNKLAGEIPVELTGLTGLLGLNLSNNHLSGRIPEYIGNMKSLNSLDFSGNELTGMIPRSIADLNFLSHLNLSHNNLSGQIPTGNQLQTLYDEDPSIYVGNNGLCGYPFPNNCFPYEEPGTTHKNNYKTAGGSKKAWLYGLDIMCGFATGFWGVIGVLVFKKQWRHKFFMFAEATTDKIYVAAMVQISKMRWRT